MSNKAKGVARKINGGGVELTLLQGGNQNSSTLDQGNEIKQDKAILQEPIQDSRSQRKQKVAGSEYALLKMLFQIINNYAIEKSYILKKVLIKVLVAACIIYLLATDITLAIMLIAGRFLFDKPLKKVKLIGAGLVSQGAIGFARKFNKL